MISREICEVVYLKKTTETTPIMDEFAYSKKEYLIIRNFFTYKNFLLSLIVCKNFKEKVKIANKPFIITELKKCADQDIYSSFPKELDPLVKAIKKVISNQEIKAGDVLSLEKPIVFGAQIYMDRLDSVYDPLGYGLFSQIPSPPIGDVTWFYIVGLEIEQQFF